MELSDNFGGFSEIARNGPLEVVQGHHVRLAVQVSHFLPARSKHHPPPFRRCCRFSHLSLFGQSRSEGLSCASLIMCCPSFRFAPHFGQEIICMYAKPPALSPRAPITRPLSPAVSPVIPESNSRCGGLSYFPAALDCQP